MAVRLRSTVRSSRDRNETTGRPQGDAGSIVRCRSPRAVRISGTRPCPRRRSPTGERTVATRSSSGSTTRCSTRAWPTCAGCCDALLAGARRVVVDLTGARHLPSLALASLLSAHHTWRARGGAVVLRGTNRGIQGGCTGRGSGACSGSRAPGAARAADHATRPSTHADGHRSRPLADQKLSTARIDRYVPMRATPSKPTRPGPRAWRTSRPPTTTMVMSALARVRNSSSEPASWYSDPPR